MTEWLYAIELSPSGHVKVGRTSNLPKRLGAHMRAAAFGGGSVARVFSVACAESVAAERELLAAVAGIPGSRVVHGTEMFSGVPLSEVTRILGHLAVKHEPIVEQAHPNRRQQQYPLLVRDCRAVLVEHDADRMHLADLLRGLQEAAPAIYRDLTTHGLALSLRSFGVKVDQLKLRGINKHGVRLPSLVASDPAEVAS